LSSHGLIEHHISTVQKNTVRLINGSTWERHFKNMSKVQRNFGKSSSAWQLHQSPNQLIWPRFSANTIINNYDYVPQEMQIKIISTNYLQITKTAFAEHKVE